MYRIAIICALLIGCTADRTRRDDDDSAEDGILEADDCDVRGVSVKSNPRGECRGASMVWVVTDADGNTVMSCTWPCGIYDDGDGPVEARWDATMFFDGNDWDAPVVTREGDSECGG